MDLSRWAYVCNFLNMLTWTVSQSLLTLRSIEQRLCYSQPTLLRQLLTHRLNVTVNTKYFLQNNNHACRSLIGRLLKDIETVPIFSL